MQWEAFFRRFIDILIEILRRLPLASVFSGNFLRAAFLKRSPIKLNGGFGEDVHAADLGGHPEF